MTQRDLFRVAGTGPAVVVDIKAAHVERGERRLPPAVVPVPRQVKLQVAGYSRQEEGAVPTGVYQETAPRRQASLSRRPHP